MFSTILSKLKRCHLLYNKKIYMYRIIITLIILFFVWCIKNIDINIDVKNSIGLILYLYLCEGIFWSLKPLQENSLFKSNGVNIFIYMFFSTIICIFILEITLFELSNRLSCFYMYLIVPIIILVTLFVLILRNTIESSRLANDYYLQLTNVVFSYIQSILFTVLIIGTYYFKYIKDLDNQNFLILSCKVAANGFRVISGQLLDSEPTSIIFIFIFSIGSIILTLVSNKIISNESTKRIKKFFIELHIKK